MSEKHLARLALSLAGMVACTTSGGGPHDDGGNGSGAPPFTHGVSTLAGAAEAGYVDGNRDIARFNNPVNVAVCDDTVYVADFDNGKIRSVAADGTSGTVIAKQGFSRPFGITCGATGTLFVTTDNDPNGNHGAMTGTVWKIDIHARTATAIAAAVGRPRGIVVLTDGRLALSDYEHHVIELLDPAGGKPTILAGALDQKGMVDGAAAAARFSTPSGIVQRSDGKLVVCDKDNSRLRLVGLDGSVTTLAGNGTSGFVDGTMTMAQFDHPQGLAIAQNGDLFVSDLDNFRIRRLRGQSVDTVAGSGAPGYVDNDDRLASEFSGLEGLAVKRDASMIYVADGTRGEMVPYNRVRQIQMP